VPGLVPQPVHEADALQRHRQVPRERPQEREVVVGEAGPVAQPVRHGQGPAGPRRVQRHDQHVTGVTGAVGVTGAARVLGRLKRPADPAVLVDAAHQVRAAVVAGDGQLHPPGVQQRLHPRQQAGRQVLRVVRPLAAVDEVLQVLQGPVPSPEHEVGAVGVRRHGGDADEEEDPEGARADQEGGDEPGRGVEGHEEAGGQQDLHDVLGADGSAVDPDDQQDDRAHHHVDDGEREVARHCRRRREPAVVGDDGVAQHQHGADVERVGGEVERELHRRHPLDAERDDRRRQPGGDEQPRRAEQQPQEQRHAGEGERVRLPPDLDPRLPELGEEEQDDEGGDDGGRRDPRRDGQQRPGGHPAGERDGTGQKGRGERQRQDRGVCQATDRPETDGVGLRAVR
jgi:hypothetical protein